MPLSPAPEAARAVLAQAELLCTPAQINAALDQMAVAITAQLATQNPLVLVVMNGGFIPAAQLLSRLDFPLRVGYLHATRYQGETQGGRVEWLATPQFSMVDERILIVDDIFDEGYTLKAIINKLHEQGAAAIYSAVLVNKQHDRKVAGLHVDFIGVNAPDRYMFGCGMDYKGFWRQLPAVYAIGEG